MYLIHIYLHAYTYTDIYIAMNTHVLFVLLDLYDLTPDSRCCYRQLFGLFCLGTRSRSTVLLGFSKPCVSSMALRWMGTNGPLHTYQHPGPMFR